MNRKTKVSAVSACAVLVFTGTTAEGCDQGGPSLSKACAVEVSLASPPLPSQPAHSTSYGQLEVFVAAEVRAQCTEPPVSHSLGVAGQRKVGGTWATVRSGHFNSIPSTEWVTHTVRVRCANGMWRALVNVDGTGPKPLKVPFSLVKVSPESGDGTLVNCNY